MFIQQRKIIRYKNFILKLIPSEFYPGYMEWRAVSLESPKEILYDPTSTLYSLSLMKFWLTYAKEGVDGLIKNKEIEQKHQIIGGLLFGRFCSNYNGEWILKYKFVQRKRSFQKELRPFFRKQIKKEFSQ